MGLRTPIHSFLRQVSWSLKQFLPPAVIIFFFLLVHPLYYSFGTPHKTAKNTSATANSLTWTSIAPGLFVGIVPLPGGLLPGEVTLIRSSLKHLRPQVVRSLALGKPRSNAQWIQEKTGASLCINANFFDPNGNPLGLIISRGIEYRPVQFGGSLLTGLFLIYRDNLVITSRDTIPTSLGFDALQAGPILVTNGSSRRHALDDNSTSRRSGICLTSDKDYIIFTASSTLRGTSLGELADILANPQVGCMEALNFDGGGSTQLYIPPHLPGSSPEFQGINVVGRDEIPVALCLFPVS